jgi:L-ascorbate metabolism protein UlaG (beta-lactamase superfamily)
VKISWWGHATCSIELGGLSFLTDPTLTARVMHLNRHGLPAPAAGARIADVVVISHLHADHLHVPSLRLLPETAQLIAPVGTAALLARIAPELAPRVQEVAPDDELSLGTVSLRVVPAHHDGHRWPHSRHCGPALGYVLTADGQSVWFAGDTGLFDGLGSIGPVDVAIVPVGGWGPTLGPHHLDPVQAAEAVGRVAATDTVPIHYGTFWPTGLRPLSRASFEHKCLEPGRRFATALTATGSPVRAHVLDPGGSITIAQRSE